MKSANLGPAATSAAMVASPATLHGVHWVGATAGVGTLKFADAVAPATGGWTLTIDTPNARSAGYVACKGGGLQFGTAISVTKSNAAVTIVYATA